MNIGSRQEHVNPWMRRILQRLPCPLDIRTARARQPRNNGPPHHRGNRLYRLKIPLRRNWESGFDDVHTQAVQLVNQSQLLLPAHTAVRRLLPVAKSRIKNRHALSVSHDLLVQRSLRVVRPGIPQACRSTPYTTDPEPRSKTYISSVIISSP